MASCALRSGTGWGRAPLRLDYRPNAIVRSMEAVRARLAAAADAVARDWWVPASYERLAVAVRKIGAQRKAERALPIVSRTELRRALTLETDDGLQRLATDALLLQRGVEYLEAVGDVLTDSRLDCLLLDPVGWFASFLAHFIRDDGNRPTEVVRGVVGLTDVVAALSHEYARPDEQVPEVMALVCKLELAVPHFEGAGLRRRPTA